MAEFILWAGGTIAAYLYFLQKHRYENSSIGYGNTGLDDRKRNDLSVNAMSHSEPDTGLQHIDAKFFRDGGRLSKKEFLQHWAEMRVKNKLANKPYSKTGDPWLRHSGRRPLKTFRMGRIGDPWLTVSHGEVADPSVSSQGINYVDVKVMGNWPWIPVKQ